MFTALVLLSIVVAVLIMAVVRLAWDLHDVKKYVSHNQDNSIFVMNELIEIKKGE